MSSVSSILHRWPGDSGRQAPVAFTSTRAGGVGLGPYASLNVGRGLGDEDGHVTENRSRLLAAHGLDGSQLALCHQTHSTDVAIVTESGSNAAADALVTQTPGLGVGVMVADCVPVLLWSVTSGAVAAVHAGRVGMYGGIIQNTVTHMRDAFGVIPEECCAIVGPSIGPCCYEVSGEIATAFRARFGADVASARQLDLWTTASRLLAGEGLFPANVRIEGLCSSCGPADLFSCRRDGGTTGRMMSVVVAPGRP